MIQELVLEGDRRGISNFAGLIPEDPFRRAAADLYRIVSPVMILTGFYIPEAGAPETDGPPGAVCLGRALVRLGKQVIYIAGKGETDIIRVLLREDTKNSLIETFPCAGDGSRPVADAFANRLLETHSPGAVIAVERPGPDESGRFLTSRNRDISDRAYGPHRLFAAPDVVTVGIGDGGNELGLGILRNHIPRGHPGTVTPADHVLLGATSNWAAFGLTAALEIISGNPDLLPLPEWGQWSLEQAAGAGAVDGITALCQPTVDGFPVRESCRILDRLRILSRSIQAAQREIDVFNRIQARRYGVSVTDLTVKYDIDRNAVSIRGAVLLEKQKTSLQNHLISTGIHAELRPDILSDPDCSTRGLGHAGAVNPPADILDRPEGRLTNQIALSGEEVRVLWQNGNWILIQAPDLSLGWSLRAGWSIDFTGTGRPPTWRKVRSATRARVLPAGCSFRRFRQTADSYIGVPYLLGGATRSGIDCSALAQLLYREARILLPRHSGNQRRTGIRVPLSDRTPGNLVFGVGRSARRLHVAVVLPGGLLHACLKREKVVLESGTAFEKNYRIIAVRRVADFGDAAG